MPSKRKKPARRKKGGGELKTEQLDGVSGGDLGSDLGNNFGLLASQVKVQSVSQNAQSVSNISKSDSDAQLNTVRNIKA